MAIQFDPNNPYEDPRGREFPAPPLPSAPPTGQAPADTGDPIQNLIAFLNSFGPPSGNIWTEAVEAAKAKGYLPAGATGPWANGVGIIQLPSGERITLAQGSQWVYQPVSNTPTTPSPTPGGGGDDPRDYGDLPEFGVDPSFLTPFTGRAPSQGGLPTFMAPGGFEAPTKDTLLKDPGYLFREDRLRGGIENSAAARGTLNSGGTLDEIMSNVGGFASQEYENAWNRAFSLWNQNWANSLSDFRSRFDTSNAAYDRAWNQFLTERDTYYRNQSEPFNKLLGAARLGVDAARS